MTGKRTRFPNEKGEWPCGGCGDYYPLKEYGPSADKRGTGTRPRSYCKKCHRESRRRVRHQKRLNKMRKQITYLAILDFMQDNVDIKTEFLRKHAYMIEPYMRKAEEEVMSEFKKRQDAVRSWKTPNGGDRYPLDKALRANAF
jgi:hypothetical protein